MVAGDVVSDVLPATAAFAYFVPAANVEIMIMSFAGNNTSSNQIGLADGVNPDSIASYSYNTTVGDRNTYNLKLCITNTNYLIIFSNTGNPSYSGIQIK